MPAFDVVSEIRKDEVSNAVDNARRELQTRYDFRGSTAGFELNRQTLAVRLEAEEEFQIRQMDDILSGQLARRGIEATAAAFGDITRSGRRSVQEVTFRQGIDQELGRRIIRLIRDTRLKVEARMHDDRVRVSGRSRDDLQQIITRLRAADLGQPLQYQNFRD